jgi:hypothetical protein
MSRSRGGNVTNSIGVSIVLDGGGTGQTAPASTVIDESIHTSMFPPDLCNNAMSAAIMPSVIDLLPSVEAHQQHASARTGFVYKLRQPMPRVGKTGLLQPHSHGADTFAIVDSLTILGVISSFAFFLLPFAFSIFLFPPNHK